MTTELFWLTLVLSAVALMPFPYVLDRLISRGLLQTMANPTPNDPPLAPWAQRAQRAHVNAIENLVVFAPAVLVVHLVEIGNHTTAFACQLYFFSRLVHYVVYTAGIPIVRTLAFFAGWVGIALLIARLLGAI
jgi:uncharacterized MAPEG superfamily protein